MEIVEFFWEELIWLRHFFFEKFLVKWKIAISKEIHSNIAIKFRMENHKFSNYILA